MCGVPQLAEAMGDATKQRNAIVDLTACGGRVSASEGDTRGDGAFCTACRGNAPFRLADTLCFFVCGINIRVNGGLGQSSAVVVSM